MGTEQETVEKTVEVKSDSVRQEYAFASDVKLKECKYCRVMIPKKARICPNCKMILKNYTFLKVVAAFIVIVLIGGGCYCLSAYWGLLPDSAVPVWIAQRKPAEPVLAVTTVEAPETAAGAKTVETTEVAAMTETEEPVWVSTAAEETEDGENNNGSSETAKPTDSKTDAADKEEAVDKTGDSDKDNLNEKTDAADREEPEEEAAVTDRDSVDDQTDAEDADDADETEEETEPADKTDTDAELIPANADEDEAAFRTDCEQVAYKSLLREQEEYLDEAIMLEAEVVCMVDGGLFDDNTYYLCAAEEKNGIERYYIIRDDRAVDETFILEGDILTIYGQLFGNCKLPANLIETRPTVPAVSMLYCDLYEE